MAFLLTCCLAYFIGSVPFGLLLTKAAGLGDIRTIGSGNIGTTNVLRTGHRALAALTLFLDGAKGALAVYLAESYAAPSFAAFAGLAALMGHMFPIWLHFRGGKGVATAIGVILALAWPVGLSVMGIWLLVAVVTRYSSLAALLAIGLSPALSYGFGEVWMIWACLVMVCFVTGKHEANIKRLLNGTEAKISQKT